MLPHTAAAGAARAEAMFAIMIDLATDPDDPAAALAKILALIQAAMDDVSRFVPQQMRQAASEQAQAVADSL